MRNMETSGGIGFITKFTRVFRKIQQVDFGERALDQDQLAEFSEQLKLNKYIQNVFYQKKGINKMQERMI